MRKSCLTFLLPIFLLLAQQGVVLHELSHVFADAQRMQERGRQPDPQQPSGTLCEKCLVFAHLAGAVAPHVPSIEVPLLGYALPEHYSAARRETDFLTARSRGPPITL